MQVKNNILIGCIVIFLSLNFVNAISSNIDVKNIYLSGEEISFNYSIVSNISETINYIVYVSCPSAPIPLLMINQIELEANVPFKDSYVYMSKLSDDVLSQSCIVEIVVINDSTMESLFSKQEVFNISTIPKADFELLTCREKECNNIANVFLKGEVVYFGYNSQEAPLNLNITVEDPSGNIDIIDINSSIKLKKIGAYIIRVDGAKEGYKSYSKIYYIAAIKEHVTPSAKSSKSKFCIILSIIVAITLSFIVYKLFVKRKIIQFKKS